MIEGLFLSSGIIRSPDYTMGELVRVAQSLRTDHAFRGYIHLKTIPGASAELIAQAGLYADRLSVNVELPSDDSVRRLAPEKSPASIRETMADVRQRLEATRDSAKHLRSTPRFAPAGQSTQMIIGADASDDRKIIARSAQLYGSYYLKRVYYSAFSPIPDSSSALPLLRPPLMREHRLYQADWLMRYYEFRGEEILAGSEDGMLDLAIDPKLAWALRHRAQFPVDVNRAPRDMLLRVPGLGVRVVDRILTTRRHRGLRESDLRFLVKSPAKVLPFVVAADWQPGGLLDSARLAQTLAPPAHQLSLF